LFAKRNFVITAHKASLNSNFTLNDLPGSAGRMDILARFITSSLCISHGLRKDVDVYLVIQDQLIVQFQGSSIKRLNPDERSTGALIKKAIEASERDRQQLEHGELIESTPGVYVSTGRLEVLLGEFVKAQIPVFLLDEHGEELRAATLTEPLAFILSDHLEFTESELELLREYSKISLGPVVLQADQCVPIVHNELDRRAV